MIILNISMAFYQYPILNIAEQPLAVLFDAAPYSLKNFERTRTGIVARSQNRIRLPMPKEPGYSVIHSFGEGQNPVGPVISMAGAANSGGLDRFGTLYSRVMEPASFFSERQYATDTYRRFSNITELTMVSEARKNYYFEYIFVPKSAQEAQVVSSIIGTFRKSSYPQVASGLPERTYPQNLWCIRVENQGNLEGAGTINSTGDWLGEPLPCVLSGVIVKHADQSDTVIRYTPGFSSSVVLLGLNFVEFETGTFVPEQNEILSKSEISDLYFGYNESSGSQSTQDSQFL